VVGEILELLITRLSLRDPLPSLGQLVAFLRWVPMLPLPRFITSLVFCCFRLLCAAFSWHPRVSHSAGGCAWRPGQSPPKGVADCMGVKPRQSQLIPEEFFDTLSLLFATPAAASLALLRGSVRRQSSAGVR
jgi:hypothetical protein